LSAESKDLGLLIRESWVRILPGSPGSRYRNDGTDLFIAPAEEAGLRFSAELCSQQW
jgi:hypothetical protein